MKKLEVTLYEIGELDPGAQKRARDNFRQNCDLSYILDQVIEDAKMVGLTITQLSDHHCTGYTESIEETAQLVMTEHGVDCGTHKLTKEFLDTKMSSDTFLSKLLWEYQMMYQKDLEFALTDPQVDESLSACMFLKDGSVWKGGGQ